MTTTYQCTCIVGHTKRFRFAGRVRSWFFYNITHLHREYGPTLRVQESPRTVSETSEVAHVSFNPHPLPLGESPLSRVVSDWERGGWRLVRIVPHHEYESIAVFERHKDGEHE